MDKKIVNQLFKRNEPASIGKIGFSELKALCAIQAGKPLKLEEAHDIFVGAGVFPPNEKSLAEFFDVYVDSLKSMDVLGRWLGEEEDYVVDQYCPTVSSIPSRSLEPFYWDEPWSKYLKGKKVLVVSPFTKSIESQYDKRKVLWKNENILPDFDLKTVKCPLSWYFEKDKPDGSWREVLEDLKDELNSNVFDFFLVGAGAWSLPLVVYAKGLGATSIHMGGGLQVLFGIKGKRWDSHEVISTFYNEHWVRPSKDETPELSTLVENGCYW